MYVKILPGVYYFPPQPYSMQDRQAKEQEMKEFEERLKQAEKRYEEQR